MNTEQRNTYGFPVPSKLDLAKKYVEEANKRNRLPCRCDTCLKQELEPAVIKLVNNWH